MSLPFSTNRIRSVYVFKRYCKTSLLISFDYIKTELNPSKDFAPQLQTVLEIVLPFDEKFVEPDNNKLEFPKLWSYWNALKRKLSG